jgi:uncharacterized protein YbjT (DUF2867 family)
VNSRALKILVVGATGSIGQHVVAEALGQGHSVRALVRNPSNHGLPTGTEIVVGDLTKVDTLAAALDGVEAIVFTHGTYGSADAGASVDYGGVRNVMIALAGRVVRIALMSTIGATDRKGAHDAKRRGERMVRASGCPYTIVRPGWFDHNSPKEVQLVLRQGDRIHTSSPKDGVISRRQVAQVLVASLVTESANRKTFELVAKAGPETTDFDKLFATADADPLGSLDGVHDEQNMPLSGEPAHILKDFDVVRLKAAS